MPVPSTKIKTTQYLFSFSHLPFISYYLMMIVDVSPILLMGRVLDSLGVMNKSSVLLSLKFFTSSITAYIDDLPI